MKAELLVDVVMEDVPRPIWKLPVGLVIGEITVADAACLSCFLPLIGSGPAVVAIADLLQSSRLAERSQRAHSTVTLT